MRFGDSSRLNEELVDESCSNLVCQEQTCITCNQASMFFVMQKPNSARVKTPSPVHRLRRSVSPYCRKRQTWLYTLVSLGGRK